MLRGGGGGQAQFQAQVQGALRKAQGYEDELAQAMALSVMPLEGLQAAAAEAAALSRAMGEQPALDEQEALAQELLRWFKQDFFSWVNNPPCERCGSGGTQLQGTAGPTEEEAAHGAGRTGELHGGLVSSVQEVGRVVQGCDCTGGRAPGLALKGCT